MSKRKMRLLLYRMKVFTICGAAVFMSVGVRNTFKEGRAMAAYEQKIVHERVQNTTEEILRKSAVEWSQKNQTKAEDNEDIIQSMDWDAEESYYLAKIAMAEAEGEDTEGKALVMLVVLNRVWSDEFPNSIKEVILQENQFSPVANGRFDAVEPDEDCYKALEMIQVQKWDESQGSTYFESESDSTWHQENLQFLFQHGRHYFYKDKE